MTETQDAHRIVYVDPDGEEITVPPGQPVPWEVVAHLRVECVGHQCDPGPEG